MTDFDPMKPLANSDLLREILQELERFEYKLYGKIPRRFHRGEPTPFEFDLNLGVIHFTEQDFKGLTAIFARLNGKWGTEMTYCIYPSKEKHREIVLNIRASPLAPAEID